MTRRNPAPEKTAPSVLLISESDPSGAAGIQGDMATLAAIGTYAMAVPTALTVQGESGVKEVHPLQPHIAKQSISLLLKDMRVDAVKIGMLHNYRMAKAVLESLQPYRGPVVLDPVTHRLHRTSFVDHKLHRFLLTKILPRATVVTPNLKAASALCQHPIDNLEMMIAAAKALQDFGAGSVLVKGGGLSGDPVDALVDQTGFALLWGTRRDLNRTRGGGSAIATAIAAALARGLDPRQACIQARIRLDYALATDHPVGHGTRTISHRALGAPGALSR